MICIVNAYKTTDISKQELEQALSNGMMIDAPPVNSLFSCDANKVSEGEVGIRIRYERNSVVVDFEANGNVKGRVLNKSQSRTLVEPIGSDYVASIQCHTTRSCNGVRP